MTKKETTKVCFVAILTLLLNVGLNCFYGWIFMLLWNWLGVGLFSVPTLNYWTCVGIVFVLKFLGNLIFPKPSKNNAKI